MTANALDEKIDAFLRRPPYEARPDELLDIMRSQVLRAAQNHPGYGNYVDAWPIKPTNAKSVADLPYLPVTQFKSGHPINLVPPEDIKRTLFSSATSGQSPSQIPIDHVTAQRMTRGTSIIASDYIGKQRRPYLVIDAQASNAASSSLIARGAAIRGLQPFSQETVYCLSSDANSENLLIDEAVLDQFVASFADEPVLIYGFTFILWQYLILPLIEQGRSLGLKNATLMHSGGWKKLTEMAVDKETFNRKVSDVIGLKTTSVVDFYGMIENVGIIYPDCSQGHKHAPSFGTIILRNPLTMTPVEIGQHGIIQVCSILPNSFPGHLLLTEDMGELVLNDGCACGRPGQAFRFSGRVPKAEVRGCGDVHARRHESFAA